MFGAGGDTNDDGTYTVYYQLGEELDDGLIEELADYGLIIQQIDPATEPGGGEAGDNSQTNQEDTRTDVEKLRDLLMSKYNVETKERADEIIAGDDNGNPRIEWEKNENGDVVITVVYPDRWGLGLWTNEVQEAFEADLTVETVRTNESAQNAADTLDDAGGWLLKPLFDLVNFLADAITGILGQIMTGQWGIQTPGAEEAKPEKFGIDSSNLMKSDVFGIVASDFPGGLFTSTKYYRVNYSPEQIFSGAVEILSIDFISGKTATGAEIRDSGWTSIREVISQWYKVLRMIAIIGLLSVLIYTGIKIIISANAKDKAKYKEWIINWFIAVAILFSMHYIMTFITSVTGEISQLINASNKQIIVEWNDRIQDANPADPENTPANKDRLWVTNLMGLVRFMVQKESASQKIGYEVIYIALLVYTIKFTFVYLKRVLNVAFLTLIAPIVALTYPIDKLNDGNAQGFNMWLKEYIFNALLQPMHLILYYILVGSAVTIAASNPIYGIVVLMFMSEAEKLLKKIFGFDKASGGTVGGMAGAFAAGAIASNIKNIAKLAGKGSGGNGGKGGGGSEKNPALDSPKPTEKDSDMNAFLDSPAEDGDAGGDGQDSNDTPSIEDRMNEADEENGEFDDTGYREAMLRGANGEQDSSAGQPSDEEIRENLREQGWSEDDINDTLGAPTSPQQGQENSGTGGTGAARNAATPSTAPIHDIAAKKEQSRFAKGAKAVGKRLLKPVWDLDKSKSYNFKRLGKGALKTTAKVVGGFALGATAAAVQAGISITDGKYNPMEGIATFSAGFAGAGGLVDKIGGGMGTMIDAYRDGSTAGDKQAIMERAQARFADRDDVIEFNKKQYPGEEQARMERERDHYLPKGVTDLKEMKSCMRYADSLVGKTEGLDAAQIAERRKQADAKAAATLDFKNRLKDQGQLATVYDKSKREQYIQTMVAKAADADKETTRRKYENAFKSIAQFDAANA